MAQQTYDINAMQRATAHGRLGKLAIEAADGIDKAVAKAREQQAMGLRVNAEMVRAELLNAAGQDMAALQAEEVQRLQGAVEVDRQNWQKARAESAAARAPIVADEGRRLDGMRPAELVAAAEEFMASNGPGDMDSLNLLSTRLRDTGEEVHFETLRDVMAERRSGEPWTHSENYDDLQHVQTVSGRGAFPTRETDGARGAASLDSIVMEV